MKRPFAFAALALALSSTLSCEQQSWEQTKMFNQNRHVEGHGQTHGEAAAGASHSDKAGAHTTPAAGHDTKSAGY